VAGGRAWERDQKKQQAANEGSQQRNQQQGSEAAGRDRPEERHSRFKVERRRQQKRRVRRLLRQAKTTAKPKRSEVPNDHGKAPHQERQMAVTNGSVRKISLEHISKSPMQQSREAAKTGRQAINDSSRGQKATGET